MPFVLAHMNATGCISGQNKNDCFYSGSESSMPWEGLRVRFKVERIKDFKELFIVFGNLAH